MIIAGYLKSQGKHSSAPKEKEVLLNSPPDQGDYLIIYTPGIIKCDIDDYSHKDGSPEGFIHGKPRSDYVAECLDRFGYKYNGVVTEHGKHFFGIVPNYYTGTDKNKNCLLAGGFKGELFFHGVEDSAAASGVREPVIVNGIERKCFRGSFDNDDISEFPPWLLPVKLPKNFDMNFVEGNRNSHISEYAFILANNGFTPDQVRECILVLNGSLGDPLEDREIEDILRPSTMEKLETVARQKNRSIVSPEVFREYLNTLGMSTLYNEAEKKIEYRNIPNTAAFQNINDKQNMMPIALQYGFREYTGKNTITKSQTTDLIALEADQHSYNPVRDYLTAVPWDGVDRFPALYEILGVTDPLQQILVKKWFYQTAALAFNSIDNPLQAEGVLILQGAEGIGKSRFFQQLAVSPRWFGSLDKELNTKNKDILIEMLSVWIAEIGEADRTFKANKSDLKNFITQRVDKIRKPYRPEEEAAPRTTSFCGTTNKITLLNADTGVRRWWIIPVDKKIVMGTFVERDNLQQFWNQCYAAFAADHECFRLTDDEQKQLIAINSEDMELLPAEEELLTSMNFNASSEKWVDLLPSQIRFICEYNVGRYSTREIGCALTAIAATDKRICKKRAKQGMKWHIPPYYGNVRK